MLLEYACRVRTLRFSLASDFKQTYREGKSIHYVLISGSDAVQYNTFFFREHELCMHCLNLPNLCGE